MPRSAECRSFANRWRDGAIHSRAGDRITLVCTGSEGIHGCLDKPEVFLKAHETPAIDYVTVHMWLKNWNWLKNLSSPILKHLPPNPGTCRTTQCPGHRHAAQAAGAGGDWACPTTAAIWTEAPTTARDEYFRRMFDQVAESCRAGRALHAAQFLGVGRRRAAWAAAASSARGLMGDPFCEPQGLNSVSTRTKAPWPSLPKRTKNSPPLPGDEEAWYGNSK